MKKSKSSSKRRDRSRSRSDDSKSKRPKARSPSREKEKAKKTTKTTPRKTRWQADDKKDSSKKTQTSEPVVKKEKPGPPPRIKDFLHNKEKIVDLLFQTVTGAALQELIPDYLKNRSKEELKKLCLEQIQTMTDELILQIISGKLESSNKDEEKKVEKEQNLKLEQPNIPKENEERKEVSADQKKEPEVVSNPTVESKLPEIAIDIPTTHEAKEETTKGKKDEENQIPLVIKDEVAKDLILPERDAELLELEMRARAIRSLLKAKSQAATEDEVTSKEN